MKVTILRLKESKKEEKPHCMKARKIITKAIPTHVTLK
jgi:hypothetical protein